MRWSRTNDALAHKVQEIKSDELFIQILTLWETRFILHSDIKTNLLGTFFMNQSSFSHLGLMIIILLITLLPHLTIS